jgi:hypothetical protein
VFYIIPYVINEYGKGREFVIISGKFKVAGIKLVSA